MKKLNLSNVTFVVALGVMTAFISNANDKINAMADKKIKEVETVTFAVLDKNADGVIDKSEIENSKAKSLAASFSQFDLDADEKLSKEEFEQALRSLI